VGKKSSPTPVQAIVVVAAILAGFWVVGKTFNNKSSDLQPVSTSATTEPSNKPSIFSEAIAEVGDDQMQAIENKVAEDAVKQYEIAKREGDKMQIYIQASLVAAAYLQANDEPNYRKWKAIERKAGNAAGL
jgi:hypothetical protein